MVEFLDKSFNYDSMSEGDIKMLNPLIWAYIGDAVYELFIRSYTTLYEKGKNGNVLHKQSIKFAKAEAQSNFLEVVTPNLTDEELNVIRRGRNTKTKHTAKNADVIDYRRATALEALIGYLYLLRRFDRINEIMNMIFSYENQNKI